MNIPAKIRSEWNDFFSLYPSLMTLCTVLTVLLTEVLTGWGTLFLTGVILFLTGIFLFLTGVRHTFFRTVLPSFLLLCSLHLQERQGDTDELNRLLGFRQSAGAILDLTICDRTLFRSGLSSSSSSPSSGDLLPVPGRIPCRVTSLRFSEQDPGEAVSAKVLLVLPERFRKIPLCYGMRLRGRGVLRKAEAPLLAGLFDYSRYLRSRKIHYLFHPDELCSIGKDDSFLTAFYSFRDRILSSVLKGIRSPRARALAGGMLFGCRQGLDHNSRKEFLRSGLIHIFTVSGLHIGLFASGVFLVLIFLKMRPRMITGTALVWVYGLMTGLQMPSLRALVMLSCWSLTKAFLLPGSGLNSIFLAGSLLLIKDPFQIREAGFHYSFLCVIFLVTAGNGFRSFLDLLQEKAYFRPEGFHSLFQLFRYKFFRKSLSFLAGCGAAWVCSFILTAFHQSVSIHLAAFANGVILILAYSIFLIFTLFFLPALFWEPAGVLSGRLLEKLLILTEKISLCFSRWTGENVLASPSWYPVLLALILAWILLQFPGRKRAVWALCALGLLLLWYLFCGGRPHGELILGSTSAQKGPFWCLSLPEEGFCAAGNIPDFRTAAELAQYLKRRGHNSLTLLVTSAQESSRREESFLADLMRTGQVVHLRRSSAGRLHRDRKGVSSVPGRREILLSCGSEPFRFRHGRMFFEILWKKDQISFDILQKVGKLSFMITRSGAGDDTVHLFNGSSRKVLHLSPGSERRRIVKRILRDPGKIWIR